MLTKMQGHSVVLCMPSVCHCECHQCGIKHRETWLRQAICALTVPGRASSKLSVAPGQCLHQAIADVAVFSMEAPILQCSSTRPAPLGGTTHASVQLKLTYMG